MGKKKKKAEEPSGPKGAPDWVVTFTDMISLLVTFFVLLLTFSSTEDHDRLRVDGFMSGTRGAVKSRGGHLARETLDEDIVAGTDIRRGADQSHSRPVEELEENLEEMGQKKTDEHQEMDFSAMKDGLQIVFGPECSFKPGSSTVNPELAKSLEELAEVMSFYKHLVVVEGYSDNAFQSNSEHPNAESLSLKRAIEAVEVMLASSDLNPNLLQIAGLGEVRPRGDNETLEGRLENRRVEIRVISLSQTRTDHYVAEKKDSERGGF
ncbi:MAG: chemotaxis protein MotB [Planctomycetota bacterium]